MSHLGGTTAILTTNPLKSLQERTWMQQPPAQSSEHQSPTMLSRRPISFVLQNDSPKPRSRKHEIDFLVRSEAEPPTKKIRTSVPDISNPSPVRVRDTPSFSDISSLLSPLPDLQLPKLPKQVAKPLILAPNQSSDSHVRCSECNYSSPDAATVVAHARITHPNKPYACGICGRCFGEKGNLNKHHRTVHLRQRKHACAECGRSFAFQDGLNRHISMVHLDRRPFKCTVCLCIISHSPSVPCTHICGIRFKQKSHHRRHVRSVHHIELPNSP